MAVVLLHGNPETPVIWDPLKAELGRTDVHTPQLPGFGCAVPNGFGATKEEYALWLVAELEPIVYEHGPVDFVGHDWGGGIGMRAVSMRPHLFRTWACDVLGLFHPDYVWHDFAQIWQTPAVGEQFFVDTGAIAVPDRVNMYVSMGMTPEVAADVVAAGNDEMNRCVLALYRSAIQPAMAVWGNDAEAAAARPGLVIINTEDHFVGATTMGYDMAARMGAHVELQEGLGHWWMLQDPERGAAVLQQFWATL